MLLASLLVTSSTFATQYRSRATGTWTTNTTWDISINGGLTWAPAGVGQFPASTATDTVFVLAAHTITMNGNPGNCRTLTVSGILNWTLNRTTNVGVGGVGDLTLTGGTLQGTGTGVMNVAGSLIVPVGQSGTIQNASTTITGATSISGTINFTVGVNGNKNFVGGVTINSGGAWYNPIGENIFFRGGFTNNGTFSSGAGVYNFNTNSQVIGGDSAIVFASASITGAITVTNNGSVTVTGNLTGANVTSTWLNASGSTLNVGGTVMATGVLTATDAPNTINYNGAVQTVKPTTYSNLFLSGSGTKTTTGVTVLDTLSRRGTAVVSAAPTYSERAVLEYRGSTAQTTGAEFPSPLPATVLVNNANGVTLDAAKIVNDSIIVRTGSLSDGGFQITGNAADSLILGAGTSLVLTTAGATPFPTNFGTNLSPTSTVVYGGGAQTISTAPTYGHVTVQAAGVKSTAASSTLNVLGNLTLASGTTFQPGAGAMIALSGDWTDNGATFTAGTSAAQFVNISAAQSINGSAASQTFNAITVAKSGTALSVGGSTTTLTTSALTMSSGTFNVAPTTTVNGTLTLNGGTLAVGTSALTLNSAVTGTGTTISSSPTGSVIYNQGSSGQPIYAANYGNLTFSSFSKTLPSATIGISGTFSTGGATGHTIAGNTIDFNGSGAQTIPVFTYQHLTISGARGGQTITLASGTIEVKGDLNVTATAVSYGATGNTIAFTGSTVQAIDALTFTNATINNASGVTLDGSMTVNGTLTLSSGNITTGASRVIVASGAAINRTSGHIVGTLERGVSTGSPTVGYPLGTTSVYVPVTVAFEGVSMAGALTATTADGDHPNVGTSGLNSALSVNRYWSLTNSGVTFDSADVTLQFDAGDVDGGATTSAFEIASYLGGSWIPRDVGTRTATSTQATGVTGFGDFQIAEPFTGQTYTWDNGGGTSAWGTAANWDPNGVPGATDNAIINTAATVEVSDARSVTTLTIEHASAVFRVVSGGSMSIAGNLILTDGTVETQAAFPAVTGAFNMASGTVIFSGAGPQTIPALNYVNLTSSNTGGRTLAAGTIGIAGAFTPGSNSYTVTGNTVDFNGSSSQTIAAFGYNNLTSSSTGARTLASSGTIGIAGTFNPGTNSYTITGSTIDFTGAGAQAIPASLYNNLSNSGNGNRTLASSDTIKITGVFTPGSGAYTTTGSTVEFNGSGLQTIPAIAYNNLRSSNTGARTLASSGTIGIAGTFTPGSNAYTVTGSTLDFTSAGAQAIPATVYNNLSNSGNGNRTLASSGTIGIAGTFTPGSGVYSTAGSTVEFNGSGSQTIPAIAYNNLISSNTGTRTLAPSGTIGIAGTFTPGSNSYTVTGSTVDFNGAGSQTVPAFTFNDLTISGSRGGATVSLGSGTIAVGGIFSPTLTSAAIDPNGGTFDYSSSAVQAIPAFTYHHLTNSGDGDRTLASSGTISILGDFSAGAGAYTVTGSTIAYTGSASQSVSAFSYVNLTVDNASGVVMAGASAVSGTLTLTDGAVALSSDTLSIASTGSVSRTSGWVAGPLKKYVPTGATTRTFEIGDASVYAPVVVAFASVTAAGDLAVSTTSAEHPNVATSSISSALNANRYWTLAPNGVTYTTASVTLNFDPSDVDVGADPTTFIVDQYDQGAWQGPTTGTVTSTSTQATGVTGFGDFVVGTDAGTVITSTATGGDWNVGTTWIGGAVPGNNAYVVIATTGGNAVTVTASPSNVRTLTISDGAILQGNGTATTLNLNLATGTNFVNNGTFNANGITLRLASNSTWNGTGTYTLGAIDLNTRVLTLAFTSPETLSVGAAGNPFLNAGTLNPGTNSYVRFNGSSAQTLSVSAANLKFNGVIIDNGAGVTANANVTGTKVTGDIFVNSGFFDDGGFNVALASNKDFTVAAGATYRTGGTSGLPTVAGSGVVSLDTASTVVYYGSTQLVTQTTYGDLTIQNTGTKTFEGDTTRIAGDFTITGATVDLTTNQATVELIGSGPQLIPAVAYYRLLVTGTGPVTPSGPISLGSDLEVRSGVFDNIGNTVTMSSGRSVIVADNATFRAGGTTSLPTVSGGGALSLDTLSVVEYYGSDQSIQAAQYGTLRFLNAGTKTLTNGTTGILGALDIVGATIDAVTNTSAIAFNGTLPQSIPVSFTYFDLLISSGVDTSVHKTVTGDLTLAGAISIAATGNLDMRAYSILALGVGSSNTGKIMWQGPNVYIAGTGTTEFYGAGSGAVAAGPAYGNLWFNGSGTMSISGNVTATGGTAAFGVTIVGGLTINGGGSLIVSGMDLNNDGLLINNGTLTVQ